MSSETTGKAPPFDPNAQHQQRPRLRPVRGFPAHAGEQMFLGLADARQISDKVVFVAPAFQDVLPLMDGGHGLDDIVTTIGRGLTRGVLETVVAQLDDAGLLFGPRYDSMLAKMRSDFDSTMVLPPASTAAMADQLALAELGAEATEEQKAEIGTKKLAEMLDQWIGAALKNTERPSFDALPKAVIAPHIDYVRGWMNYAHAWGRMRVVDRPARVVILGTNHFGESSGVCACDKGFQSPLGTCEGDKEFVRVLRESMGTRGESLFANRYDHEREHSIELQIPWIQRCLGKDDKGQFCKVFGALVHDPSVNNGESYDGKGVALDPFVDAMRRTIEKLPGRTLVVSSADLSHVGPAFGDEGVLAGDAPEVEQRRNKVFEHDREMLKLYSQGKLDELVASLAWQQNPTRWCSAGNMIAAMKIVGGEKADLLNYAAAMDGEGHGMVSHAAAAIY